jgi:cyclopropane fatty-acyl-phospholipid synthase-like methyltransferase
MSLPAPAPEPLHYDGAFYRDIGDFIRSRYLDWGFTRGTEQEVAFLIDLLKLPEHSHILDIGCGVGRHSLALSRRGFQLTGIDISSGMIEVAQKAALAEKLPAEFIAIDARHFDAQNAFDAAICLCEGAFGLLGTQADHLDVLRRIHRALKPDGQFVLTAINALSAAQRAKEVDRFDPYTCTSAERVTITGENDEQREVQIWTTAFTYPQLELMLQTAGFTVDAGYGCVAGSFSRKPLEIGDMEIMMVARPPLNPEP